MAGLATGQFLAQFVGLPGKLRHGLGVATIHSACGVIGQGIEVIRRPHKGRCSEPRRAPKYAGLPVPLPRAAGLQGSRISSYKLQELQVYKLQETRKGKEGCYKNCKSRVVISWFLRDVRYVKKRRCVSESIRVRARLPPAVPDPPSRSVPL